MRRVTVHVFVDESRRRDCYQLAAAFVEPRDLQRLRKQLRQLLMPGQRELHFKRESDRRQRFVVDAVVRLGVNVPHRTCGEAGRGRGAADLR
jgi:hypothetical protein